MLKASRDKRFEALFTWYNERYLIRRGFHSVWLRGEIDIFPTGRPTLYIMNHSSWWDGLLVYHAIRSRFKGKADRLDAGRMPRRHYMMMDEKGLRQYPFFRKIGAFSVDKSSRRGMLESLQYGASLLNEGDGVWLFPQGDIRHLEQRPLTFGGGAAYLLERCPETVVVPVTAYYSLGNSQRPVASLWFGESCADDWEGQSRKGITARLEHLLEDQLDHHRELAIAGMESEEGGFRQLIVPGQSVSDTFRSWKRRASQWKSFFGS